MDRDCVRDTALRSAKFAQGLASRAAGNINVVPRPVLEFIADVVGPGGSVRESVTREGAAIAFELRIDGILAKKLVHKLARFGSEIFFRNQRYGLVALATPGPSGSASKEKCNEREQSGAAKSGKAQESCLGIPGAQALSQRPTGFQDSV